MAYNLAVRTSWCKNHQARLWN